MNLAYAALPVSANSDPGGAYCPFVGLGIQQISGCKVSPMGFIHVSGFRYLARGIPPHCHACGFLPCSLTGRSGRFPF